MSNSLPEPSAVSSLFTIPAHNSVRDVKLHFIHDGTITNVHLFPSQANIVRSFKFPLKSGRNTIIISGVPDLLDDDSIRVEAHGSGVIKVVMVSTTASQNASEQLSEDILRKRDEIKRKQKDIDALSAYISTMNINSVSPTDIMSVIKDFNLANVIFDNELLTLNKELAQLQLALERENLDANGNTITVGVSGDSDEEAGLTVHYATTQARWTPVYDLHVNTESEEHSIKLVYKASITQNTDEDWDNIHLVLEASESRSEFKLPHLSPWKLSLENSTPYIGIFGGVNTYKTDSIVPRPGPFSFPGESKRMENNSDVTLDSHNSARPSYNIPDFITISNRSIVYITIGELLGGKLNWASVPATMDLQVYMIATVLNESDYPLLKGPVRIYVNGAFTSSSDIQYVSPREEFDCALGVDPSVKVIYHPREYKHTPPSGWPPGSVHIMTTTHNPSIQLHDPSGRHSNSNSIHSFQQRITVINTKSCTVKNVKIIDHIPVSDDSTISIKLLSPSLPISSPQTRNAEVLVSDGVIAKWEAEDDRNVDTSSMAGAEGKISWNCSIPAYGRVNLVLSWTVSAPGSKVITGLG